MKRVFVAEDDAAKAFRRFYRAPSVGEEEGVGIGLYSARQMIAGENGYLEVKAVEK